MAETLQDRLNKDTAVQLALAEILRKVVAHIVYDDDPAVTQGRLQVLHDSIVGAIEARVLFPNALPEEQKSADFIKEAAISYASRLITSIQPK